MHPTSPEAEAWKAELTLERLEANADIAASWEAETCRVFREKFAAIYRRLVGVHPRHREAFRDALLRVRDGGGMAVEELIERFENEKPGSA
ncbi:MAG: hypothetical protein KY476_14820 [Planctomycetes bacterium]|nr:hypothetical protein [Planctomycetota bacterium]